MKTKLNLLLALCLVTSITVSADNSSGKKFSYSFDDVSDNFVIITTDNDSTGSGFLADIGGETYVFTNQHVIMACKKFTIKDMNNNILKPASLEIAPERDIARIKLQEKKENILSMAKDVSINDPIVVYGNSGGAAVVTELYGKVTGEGPDRIEVTAKFIQGNSGSPIMNKDKKVVGIATYALVNDSKNPLAQDSKFNKIRRFGYKITPNIKWQKVSWSKYSALGRRLKEDEAYIDILIDVMKIWGEQPYQPLTIKDRAPKDLKSWVKGHNREYEKYNAQYENYVLRAKRGNLTQKNYDALVEKMQKATLKGGKHLKRWCDTRIRSAEFLQNKNKSAAFMNQDFKRNKKMLEALGEEFISCSKLHSKRDPFQPMK